MAEGRILPLAITVLSAAALFAGCHPSQRAQSEAIMAANEMSNGVCFGRFAAGVPPEWEAAGQSQSIYGVTVHSVPLLGLDFNSYWHQRVDRSRGNSAFQRVMQSDSATTGLWFGDGQTGVRLEAARQFGDQVLTTSLTGDRGRETIIQKLTNNVISAYQPEGHVGFCLERGVITSELGDAETASFMMKHSVLGDLNIKCLTQTVKNPLPEERLSDAREIEEAMSGAKLDRILSRKRRVAEIEGVEEWLTVAPQGAAPIVRFSWKCSGEPFSAQIPQIVIIGVAHKENQPQLTAAWNSFLDSLRKVPIAPGNNR
jgi:hypothetical protein